MMKLSWPVAAALFLLGAVISPIGDHIHVVTGTTSYPDLSVPFIWSSPFWFPLLVGGATVGLAELRLHLGPLREAVTPRMGLAGVAAVIGTYAMTGLLRGSSEVLSTTLIFSLAAITWCALGDRAAAVCGLVAAVVGAGFEAILVAAGVFSYADNGNSLLGVAPWLPGLYFGFGVTAAVLAELAGQAARREVRSA